MWWPCARDLFGSPPVRGVAVFLVRVASYTGIVQFRHFGTSITGLLIPGVFGNGLLSNETGSIRKPLILLGPSVL